MVGRMLKVTCNIILLPIDLFQAFLMLLAFHTPYWSNVLSYWEKRNESNVLFITYEDMKSDLKAVVKKVSHFLEKPLEDGEHLNQLLEHLSLDSMRDNDAVNYKRPTEARKQQDPTIDKDLYFMGEGIADGYKTKMSAELIANFDKWIEDNLRGCDFPFYKG